MSVPPPGPKPGYVDVLDLATASVIVLGTTAFFAFVYFLPEPKPSPSARGEERASESAAAAAPKRPAFGPSPRPASGKDVVIERLPAAAPLPGESRRAAQKHWDTGIVAFSKGDLARAGAEWRLCLELEPEHPDCRAGLRRLGASGEARAEPAEGSVLPSPAARADAPPTRFLVVFFERGKTALDARAASVLDAAAKLLEIHPLTRLRVVAFADRAESDPPALARRRAGEIRKALLSRKLSPERVVLEFEVAERAAFRAELHIER